MPFKALATREVSLKKTLDLNISLNQWSTIPLQVRAMSPNFKTISCGFANTLQYALCLS